MVPCVTVTRSRSYYSRLCPRNGYTRQARDWTRARLRVFRNSNLHHRCLSAHILRVEPQREPEQERHEQLVELLRNMTREEAFALAIEAGIWDEHGELTAPYRDDSALSVCGL